MIKEKYSVTFSGPSRIALVADRGRVPTQETGGKRSVRVSEKRRQKKEETEKKKCMGPKLANMTRERHPT